MIRKILLTISICCLFMACSQEKVINLSKNCSIKYVLDPNTKSVLMIELINNDNSTQVNYISDDCFSFRIGQNNNICQGVFGENGFSGQITNSKDNCVVNKTESGLLFDANTKDGYRTVVEYNEVLLRSKHYDSIKNNDTTYYVTKDGNIEME